MEGTTPACRGSVTTVVTKGSAVQRYDKGGERLLVRREGPGPGWVAEIPDHDNRCDSGRAAAPRIVECPGRGSIHESASTLLSDACRATSGASAFRAHGHFTQGGTSISVDLHWGSTGKLINFTEHGDQTVNVVINGPSIYFKANRSFWLSQTNNGKGASLLAGHWIDMTADKKDTASMTKNFTKRAFLSSCDGGGFSATYVGKASVNGVKVTKVHARGTSPTRSTSKTGRRPTS